MIVWDVVIDKSRSKRSDICEVRMIIMNDFGDKRRKFNSNGSMNC